MRLASTSKTKKVTIIAHSNGGLVIKALMARLGATTTASLIDKVIFVDVPQVGTPEAVTALLHGTNEGIPVILSDAEIRKLVQNYPMAYNLLPNDKYFNIVDDSAVTIDPTAYPQWSSYGSILHSVDRLRAFLLDTNHTRTKPVVDNTNAPEIGNTLLFDKAQQLHQVIDAWTPPAGVQLIQSAGWGVPTTIKGIDYVNTTHTICQQGFCTPYSTPGIVASTTIDGDGTVVTPSQLYTSTTT
jgi:pimeloyl-ACP methyl ester carboxylesterase